MYIPHSNCFEDREDMLAFVRRFPFGTLVGAKDGLPLATHLPFISRMEAGSICLYAHLALGNPQASLLEEGRQLAMFMEPHAYISPSHYQSELEVPTWNYVSVHLYGRCEVLRDPLRLRELLEQTIACFDPAYLKQWNRLPEAFREREMKGVVGFRMLADQLQGKKKLSQNKTPEEQQRIQATLSESPDSPGRWVAEYMKQQLDAGPRQKP